MYLACSPITWTVIRRQPSNPYSGRAGYGRLLDEIREAGYTHVVASTGRATLQAAATAGQDDESFARPEELLRFLADHGLQPAPGSASGHSLQDPGRRGTSVEAARQSAAFARGLGLDALFIMPPGGAPHRQATAGHYPQGGRPDGLSDEQWVLVCETLDAMGRACREEGVWLCMHNHAGFFMETEDEFERAIAGTDPELVGLGPDVGHMVWGGIDPLPWFQRHMGRVKSIHIKDMHADVLRQAREEKLSYQETSARGVFAEIGEGGVDFPALFDLWRAMEYTGAVIVETDRTQKPAPAESVAASRRYLRDVIGI